MSEFIFCHVEAYTCSYFDYALDQMFYFTIFRYGLFVPRSVKKTEVVKTANVFGSADSDQDEVIMLIGELQ